ncbi:alcohol dehydrogenase catalytic domain-containing protein [Companilactobacillus huachuanensis]|uniref:Alcohol dehydrogenase catalytic domain-containing protein n=1 Tax=Companilactobacillus huachuanensis TaxID=2559914 RepID=A0ABW1RLT1_9LACO|nr:zinc-binding dehydrogenase [Companilactobacillus huachuanensis]
MKAAYINQVGGIDEIKIGEISMPELHDNEVMIRTLAVSVNFVDTFVRSGGFKTAMDFPFVIGRDAVGTVVAVGTNVSRFHKDELVWTNSMGYEERMGTTSEFVAVPEVRLYSVPQGVDPIKLVSSVHSSATAAILLADILQVRQGQRILIEGAAGHVGTKLVALAKLLGLVVSTTSNIRDFSKLKSLNARTLYDYHLPVSEINGKFDYIIDTSGKVELQDNLSKLTVHGQVGLITAPKTNQFAFNVRSMYMNAQSVKGFVISHASVEQLQHASELVNDSISDGSLLDDEILQLPMEQAASAQDMLVNGQTMGKKIVLIFRTV